MWLLINVSLQIKYMSSLNTKVWVFKNKKRENYVVQGRGAQIEIGQIV